MTSGTTDQPCARCGAPIDPVFALMTGDGPVCKTCESQQLAREAQAAASFSSSSMGPMGWAIVSLFCNFFFIPSMLAITGGLRDLSALKKARALGVETPGESDRRTKAILAIVLGAFHPLLAVAAIGLVVVIAVVGVLTAPDYEPYEYDDGYAYEDGYGYDDYDYDDYGGDGDYGDEGYGGAYEAADPVAAEPPATRRVVHVDSYLPLDAQLRAHAARARAAGLRPYLYAHASWCGPCNAIARYAADPRMVRAYEGTYIIEADIDHVSDADLRASGFVVRGIPAWYGVGPDGRHDGRVITGAAWGDDVPENMAPPLERFFRGDAI